MNNRCFIDEDILIFIFFLLACLKKNNKNK